MRNLRKLLGYLLIVSPVFAILVMAGLDKGWLLPLELLGGVVLVVGVICLGAWLSDDPHA